VISSNEFEDIQSLEVGDASGLLLERLETTRACYSLEGKKRRIAELEQDRGRVSGRRLIKGKVNPSSKARLMVNIAVEERSCPEHRRSTLSARPKGFAAVLVGTPYDFKNC